MTVPNSGRGGLPVYSPVGATLSLVNGSTAAAFTGTAFSTIDATTGALTFQCGLGDDLVVSGISVGKIESVTDATHLVLAEPWDGPTETSISSTGSPGWYIIRNSVPAYGYTAKAIQDMLAFGTDANPDKYLTIDDGTGRLKLKIKSGAPTISVGTTGTDDASLKDSIKIDQTTGIPVFPLGIYQLPAGVVLDSATDCSAGINAALLARGNLVLPYDGSGHYYFCASPIVVPFGCTLEGRALNGPTGSGTRLVFAAGVDKCIKVGDPTGAVLGGIGGVAAAVIGISQSRLGSSAPAATTIGFYMRGGFNTKLVDCTADNNGINYWFQGDNPSSSGISCMMTRCFGYRAVDAYIVMDTWPEVRMVQCRFGGATGEYLATTYIRWRGGNPGTAGGPNTIVCTNCQFNSFAYNVKRFFEMVNLNAPVFGTPGLDCEGVHVVGCHIEALSESIIHTDATANILALFFFNDTTINCPLRPFFNLNAATVQLQNWCITNCWFAVSDFTLAPSSGYTGFQFIGGSIQGTMHLTGTSGSTASIVGVGHGNNFTVDGPWANLSIVGNNYYGGIGLTNNATGNVHLLDHTVGAQFNFGRIVPFGGWVSGSTAELQWGDVNNSIGSLWSDVLKISGYSGVSFNYGPTRIEAWRVDSGGLLRPNADNTRNLADASHRIAQIFAANATINTSDARQKTDLEQMSDAEIKASKEIVKQIGMFRFLDAMQSKGQDARVHVGVTAQSVAEIMGRNGLDPSRYGFFCYDQWEDEKGNEGDSYGLRYEQLLLFLSRGMEARMSALEKALGN